MYTEDDLLPLSGLQHVAFCERRWALVHLERQWAENLNTAEGELLHERAHSAKIESRPGALIRRTLPLRSLRLGLSGQADVVEFVPGEQGIAMPHRKGLWQPCPIEYKRSRDSHGEWAYRVQLCAQAMCLEEMLGVSIAMGCIFDGKRKRRDEVALDASLRSRVEELAARMRLLFDTRQTPAPCYEKKCEGCSMISICEPRAVERMRASQYLERAVALHLQSPEEPQ